MSSSSSKEVKAFLIAVRAHIASPDCWTKGTWARNVVGDSERLKAPLAKCWCLVGAMKALRTGTHAHFSVYSKALRLLAGIVTESLSWETSVSWESTLVSWNDSRYRKHAEVLDLVDRGIAAVSA